VRVRIAQLEDWNEELHAHLVNDPDDEVRQYVARRDDLSHSVQCALCADPNPEVRRALAYNKGGDTPQFVLETLATDPDENVRWQVAYNGAASDALLQRLTRDSSQHVSKTAARTRARGG
jgi:hypothetical protein